MKRSVKNGTPLAAVLLASAIGLAACGSDNDGSPAVAAPLPGASASPPGASAPPPGASAPPADAAGSSVPASAGLSVQSYIAYLRGLKTDETSAPVMVGGFMAPVDDTVPATMLGS